MPRADKFSRFEQAILSHLDAAYNLARWLTRDENEAADAVQDACLRVLRFIGGFRGGDGRAWLLAIVRNTCYSRFKRGAGRDMYGFDVEQIESGPIAPIEEFTCRPVIGFARVGIADIGAEEFDEAAGVAISHSGGDDRGLLVIGNLACFWVFVLRIYGRLYGRPHNPGTAVPWVSESASRRSWKDR